MENFEHYLEATEIIDCTHPEVRAFAEEAAGDARDEIEKAVRLYYAVRDGIWYDPYTPSRALQGQQRSSERTRVLHTESVAPVRRGQSLWYSNQGGVCGCPEPPGDPPVAGLARIRHLRVSRFYGVFPPGKVGQGDSCFQQGTVRAARR